ncbi:MAG: Peroxisome chaperone and import receptor [Caeruleum heppii]|nr:MAG: Peroxisome chaperone and import receptor [Caeruleum heppii]
MPGSQKDALDQVEGGEQPAGRSDTQSVEVDSQIPDPEEDDLDDLDDILDQFSATKVNAEETPSSSGPGRPNQPDDVPKASEELDHDLSEQLPAGVADLLRDLQKSPETQQELEKLFEDLVGSSAGGASATDSTTTGPPTSTAKEPSEPSFAATSQTDAADANFQETIRKTMQRMQESGEQATAAATSDDTDDILAEMLKQMQGDGSGMPGGEEDFSKMLLGMMEQLTNKEILFEPMKELHEKFPAWMDKNRDKTPQGDLRRYEEQQVLVSEIVSRFMQPSYSDLNASDREYIVERMQKMQAAGSPPPDLVGDMSAAQDALGDLDSNCPQQ